MGETGKDKSGKKLKTNCGEAKMQDTVMIFKQTSLQITCPACIFLLWKSASIPESFNYNV